MNKALIAAAVALAFGSAPVFAHSGGTDANGCHTNHKTGDYHCHNPKGHSSVKHSHVKQPRAVVGKSTQKEPVVVASTKK